MLKISALLPIYCNDRAISHVFMSVCGGWQGPNLQARMIVPNCTPYCRGKNLVEAIPLLLKKWYYRRVEIPIQVAEKRFLKDLQEFDAAYLWPGVSLNLYEAVKQRKKPIFLERVNCCQQKSKQILDEAYARLGIPPKHDVTEENIEKEKIEVEQADFLFCPSPEVSKSFQEAGVPLEKLLLTSEGWSPQRFANTQPEPRNPEGITVLFMGYMSVRKGPHVLLQAWERSRLKGRLVMFGNVEPAIAQICSNLLNRPDVTHYSYSLDYSFAYRQADFLALPSVEEGSPLVVYEAMAHGLPILTTPMGAGGIVRDGIDGIIVPPYDLDAWVEALQTLANSPELRAQLGAAARQRAQEFTWDRVARQRGELVLHQFKAS